jgi:hypothetical protein
MPKALRRKQRIQAVADAVLAAEVKRTTEQLPSLLPDSALFESTSTKKKKILLKPPTGTPTDQKTADVEYYDVWAGAQTSIPRPPPMNRKAKPPSSSDSYRSETHVRPPPPVEEPGKIVRTPPGDSGMGDLLAGDVIAAPVINAEPPPPPKIEKSDVVLRPFIPKWIPDAQKREMRKALREAHKVLRERGEAEFLPEFERVPEIAAEIKAEKEELEKRPKKEKEDHLLRFIAEEPEYRVDEQPERLSDAPGDQRPFARLQRSFEERRKVGLHE